MSSPATPQAPTKIFPLEVEALKGTPAFKALQKGEATWKPTVDLPANVEQILLGAAQSHNSADDSRTFGAIKVQYADGTKAWLVGASGNQNPLRGTAVASGSGAASILGLPYQDRSAPRVSIGDRLAAPPTVRGSTGAENNYCFECHAVSYIDAHNKAQDSKENPNKIVKLSALYTGVLSEDRSKLVHTNPCSECQRYSMQYSLILQTSGCTDLTGTKLPDLEGQVRSWREKEKAASSEQSKAALNKNLPVVTEELIACYKKWWDAKENGSDKLRDAEWDMKAVARKYESLKETLEKLGDLVTLPEALQKMPKIADACASHFQLYAIPDQLKDKEMLTDELQQKLQARLGKALETYQKFVDESGKKADKPAFELAKKSYLESIKSQSQSPSQTGEQDVSDRDRKEEKKLQGPS